MKMRKRQRKTRKMTMSSKKTLKIETSADMSGRSNEYIEGLKRYIRTVFSMSPYGVKDIDFEIAEEPEKPEEVPNPSELYRAMISSSLYNELVEEQELTIIAEPYTIDGYIDLTLIPVKSEDYLDVQFALCDYKELLMLLDGENIEKIKAFDMAPYKQGSDEDE
jgi:hypothetical protein